VGSKDVSLYEAAAAIDNAIAKIGSLITAVVLLAPCDVSPVLASGKLQREGKGEDVARAQL
jgi:hypothetical protein